MRFNTFTFDPVHLLIWIAIIIMGVMNYIPWNIVIVLSLLEVRCPITYNLK